MKTLLGKKVGMTQIFAEDGTVIPVTVVEAGPETVVQIKTVETDGYDAVQVGYEDQKPQRVNKPLTGHFAKAGVETKKHLAEFKPEEGASYEVGNVITVETFKNGDKVDVVGLTKGHGFTGVVKRWNQHMLMASHGVGPIHREVGSMGSISSPSRVFKNKHMPGRYGHEQVTVQNLEIVKVDAGRNALLIKGAIPGPKGGIVCISNSVKG